MKESKGKVEIVSDGATRHLVIHKVTEDDAGEYTAKVGDSQVRN